MPCYFSTSPPENEYLILVQKNIFHLLISSSKFSLSSVVGKNSGWESCRSLLYSLCTCGTVEHIKLIHSQGTQRILGLIYAFMGIVFVAIINLFSLVIDSHKALFAFMRWIVKIFLFILFFYKCTKILPTMTIFYNTFYYINLKFKTNKFPITHLFWIKERFLLDHTLFL